MMMMMMMMMIQQRVHQPQLYNVSKLKCAHVCHAGRCAETAGRIEALAGV